VLLGVRWGSLRTKIIAWLFVPTAIILLMVALVTYYAYQQVTEELVFERDEEVTRLSAGQLATELTEYTDLLNPLARAWHHHMDDPDALQTALSQDDNRLTVFDGGVVLLDTLGVVVATEPERPEILGQDWSDRAYFRRTAFSDIAPDGPNGADVIIVAVPITGDQGQFLGTAAGMFRLGASGVSAFYGSIVKLRLEGAGGSYLVDGNGRLIYHSDSERIGEDFSMQPVVERLLAGQTGAIRTRDFMGLDIVAGFAPVPGTSWGLVTEESWANLTQGSQSYQRFLLLLLGLGVVVPTVIVAYGVKRIVQPVEALIDAAKEVARGNFGQTITARTGDEIEELAHQFNRMSAQLKESYTNLEQRVADRTRELAILNAIGAIVNQSLELYQTLDWILDEALGLLNMEAGEIRLLDESTDELVIRTERGLSLEFVRQVNRLKVGRMLPEYSVFPEEPVIDEDVLANPDRVLAQQEGLRALVIIPLRAKDRLLGTLSLATRTGPRAFNRSERELLRSISDQVAVAIENAELYAETSRRVDEIETLFAVQQAITSRLDLDAVLKLIADEARRLTSSETSLAFLLDGDSLVLKVISGAEMSGVAVGYRMPLAESLTGLAIEMGQPLRVIDAHSDPRTYAELVRRLNVHSLMVMPLMSGSEPIGSISVTNKLTGLFGPEDERVLMMLASSAVIGLENARLYEAEQRRAEQFRVIAEVSRRITSILTIDELVVGISRFIKEAFNYYHVVIGLVEGDELVFRYRTNDLGNDVNFFVDRLQIGREGITGWVAATGQPLLIPDVSQEPRFKYLYQANATRSELAIPIMAKGVVIGVLDAMSDRPNAFDESDLVVLQALAHQAAIAIENAQLYERARQLAAVEERQRLARELHDSATQSLYGATMFAEAAIRLLNSGQVELAAEHMHEVRETAQEALQEMRLLIFELRPPILEEEGLIAALQTRLEAVEGRSGLQTELRADGIGQLPADIEECLYRITQEALNNALKHAHASHVAVTLGRDQLNIVLEISDDGVGFEPEAVQGKGGLGLSGMQERVDLLGGRLSIYSRPGEGVKVRVEVEVEETEPELEGV
jgi:signal transduction histidine kinase/HAMP domain-containing protein